jgi:zinc transport system substrate-binding protein
MFGRILTLSVFLGLFAHATIHCVVSIPPLKTFVEAIGDGAVRSSVMVPPGHSPHSYEPKPSQMRELERADCYFAIGLEFEKAWLPRFRAQNPRLKIVDLSEGIRKFPMQHADVAQEAPRPHEAEHLDPHIWTAPDNVRIMARKIYETLAALNPAQRPLFEKHYREFLKKIDATDREIKALLAPLPPHSAFMVFHPSWGYFAREYGLEQLPVEVEGKAPKPRQLMALIDEAKRRKVRAIFVQPEFSDKSAKLLAAELGIPVIKVSPLAPDWSANLLRLAKAIAQGAGR